MNTVQIIIEKILALIFLVFLFPLLLILFFLVKFTSRGPFLFKQKRFGKDKKVFTIYKIRTMIKDAEKLKSKIKNLNESDGPAFKIKNDPRYTKIGKLLSHTAFDEVPQLLNIIKGEMSFVGPRPLPINEANKIPQKYAGRFSVLPGMTSLWVVKGTDHSSFAKWMRLDLEYVKKKNWYFDTRILLKTGIMVLKMIVN